MNKNEDVAGDFKGNLIVPDTNVLINDPFCFEKFINGGNKVIIPLIVLTELDKLKKDLRLGVDVREVIRQIDKFGFNRNDLFAVESRMDFAGLDLEKGVPDYKIIATFNYVVKNNPGHKCKLVTNDVSMRTIAHAIFVDNPMVSVEVYKQEQVEQKNSRAEIPVLEIQDFEMDMGVHFDEAVYGKMNENAGVIIKYPHKKEDHKNLFIKKGKTLKMIKNDFTLFGLKAIGNEEEPINYGQLLAFSILTDKCVSCVFLEGQAGTGKTLIALAAAMDQRQHYEEVIIANPMVPLSNKSNMGFLPGDINEKTSPWLMPFEQNLKFLEKTSPDRMAKLVEVQMPNKKANGNGSQNGPQPELKMKDKYGLIVQPLEYIRGQTITNAFIIVEEAQNLSQHEIKTIITRLGKGSKIVFCGDLSQIDIPYLNIYSSGLTYAIEKMVGFEEKNKMVGTIMLKTTVRSELAAFASEVL